MRLSRRLLLVGILLVILSIVVTTQYATTKVGFSYSIVHPSNSDIRYIASDNSSNGGHVLRVSGNNASGNRYMTLEFGNWSEGQNKTYTAAFGIVNEEPFAVTISHCVVETHGGNDYMQVWLHGDRDVKADSDSGVMIWNKNATQYTNGSVAWILDCGDGNPATMDGSNTETPWNETSHVRYSHYDTDAVNGSDDFVWVQISLDIPEGASADDITGTVYVYFEADTHWEGPLLLSFGSESVFNSAITYDISVAALDSTRIVMAYRGWGGFSYGVTVVGTISGNSISFGDPVVFNQANTFDISAAAVGSTHVVIAYRNYSDSEYGTAVVGTISGDVIAFGSPVVFENAATQYISVTALDSTHVVIAYMDEGNSYYGTAIVGTVTGNSISFGNSVVFEEATIGSCSATALNSTHVLIAYVAVGIGSRTIVGTISDGDTISFGTSACFDGSPNNNYVSATTLDNTHVVITYMDAGSSSYGKAVVGTISGGDSISYGDQFVFNSAVTYYISATTLDSTHVVIGYKDGGNSNYGTAIVGTISGGDTLSFDSAVVFNSATTSYISATALDSSHMVIAYMDAGNSNYGTAIVGTYS